MTGLKIVVLNEKRQKLEVSQLSMLYTRKYRPKKEKCNTNTLSRSNNTKTQNGKMVDPDTQFIS